MGCTHKPKNTVKVALSEFRATRSSQHARSSPAMPPPDPPPECPPRTARGNKVPCWQLLVAHTSLRVPHGGGKATPRHRAAVAAAQRLCTTRRAAGGVPAAHSWVVPQVKIGGKGGRAGGGRCPPSRKLATRDRKVAGGWVGARVRHTTCLRGLGCQGETHSVSPRTTLAASTPCSFAGAARWGPTTGMGGAG